MPQADATVPGRQIDRISVDARPPLVLIAREGDPQAAAAIALAHDLGSRASVTLAALLGERLRRHGFGYLEVDTHGLGLEISTLIGSADEAARFLVEASSALGAPATKTEPAWGAIGPALQALQARAWAGPAEAGVAACSGDLGVLPASGPPDHPGQALVEHWRAAVFSAQSARFAVVGPAPILEQAAETLPDLPEWPETSGPSDSWPEADTLGTDVLRGGPDRLALALRVRDPARVIAAGRELARPSSTLRARLRLATPEWSVVRVASTARPRGACLRVDLEGPHGDHSRDWTLMGRLVQGGFDEMQAALTASYPRNDEVDESVLLSADPRRAAAVAAWRALAARKPAGAARRYVAYATGARIAGTEASAKLDAALSQARRDSELPSLELSTRTERGQAEVWALLGCPCPGASEGPAGAGATALAVTALAASLPRVGNVSVEPWVSSVGVGLVAHGPRSHAGEPPESHAQRVGDALGRALAQGPILSSASFLQARASLLERVGPGPGSGWWRLLDTLAPGHPELLEARGTWDTLAASTLEAVRAQAHLLLAGPLRLAVLANVRDSQGPAVRGALDRWLRLAGRDKARCPAISLPPALPGIQRLKGIVSAGAASSAYVGVRVARHHVDAARWTTWLLDRPGGWLERSVERPGLVSSARARFVGGPELGALVVEVRALAGEVDRAVAQVVAVFERLSMRSATEADFRLARAAVTAGRTQARLEPRTRLSELYEGTQRPGVPSLKALNDFLALVRRDQLSVVVVHADD